MNWNSLETTEQLEQIRQRSHQTPCLIFKHSTRCSISYMAKMRLETSWKFDEETIVPYYLDLIAHRSISNQIAETYRVHHESPQALLIYQGECVFDASHLDITAEEIAEGLEQIAHAKPAGA